MVTLVTVGDCDGDCDCECDECLGRCGSVMQGLLGHMLRRRPLGPRADSTYILQSTVLCTPQEAPWNYCYYVPYPILFLHRARRLLLAQSHCR